MTDVETFPAGRELDALVAERVMGIKVRWKKRVLVDASRTWPKGHPWEGLPAPYSWVECEAEDSEELRVPCPPGQSDDPYYWDGISAYSTDIAAAWEVWRWLTEREPWRWAIFSEEDDEVTVEYFGEGYLGDREAGCGNFSVSGAAPLAICHAALKAVTASKTTV